MGCIEEVIDILSTRISDGKKPRIFSNAFEIHAKKAGFAALRSLETGLIGGPTPDILAVIGNEEEGSRILLAIVSICSL